MIDCRCYLSLSLWIVMNFNNQFWSDWAVVLVCLLIFTWFVCAVMQSSLKKWRTASLTGTVPWQPCRNTSPNWTMPQRPNVPNTATNHEQVGPIRNRLCPISMERLANVTCCIYQHETRKTVLKCNPYNNLNKFLKSGVKILWYSFFFWCASA